MRRGFDSRYPHMISHILYDVDGVLITSRKRLFSIALAEQYGVSHERDMLPFFTGPFQKCIVGKADLKQELIPFLSRWNWNEGVDELLRFWFTHEKTLDEGLLADVQALRKRGVKCFLATNNEKYRTDYLWNELNLKSHFDGCFSSSGLGFKKEEVGFWEKVCAELKVPDKKSVLFFDDDMDNVTTARAFGLSAEFYTGFEAYEKKIAERLS